MARSIPDDWLPLFKAAGVAPSYRALAAKTEGVAVATIIRALNGEGVPEPATVTAIVGVLGNDAARLLNVSADALRQGRYEGPEESVYLDRRQRLAIDELIRAMTAAESPATESRLRSVPATDSLRAARHGRAKNKNVRPDPPEIAPDPEGPEDGA